MAPHVSICLPIYNGENHLAEAIESILEQSFKDFELIVVDDTSCDRSLEVLDRYARRDQRIQCYRNDQRKGLFANYNSCQEKATGSIIKPFAQDDLLHPEYLKTCVQFLNENPEAALFATNRNWIDEKGHDVSDQFRSPAISDYFSSERILDGKDVIQKSLIPVVNFIGEPVCVAFPAKFIGSGFDEAFHHIGDLDYWLRILTNGKLVYCPETLSSFRRHSTNQTTINRNELRIANDILKLGAKFQDLGQPAGSSKEFMHHAIMVIAQEMNALSIPNRTISEISNSLEEKTFHSKEYARTARQALSHLSTEELREITMYALGMLVEGQLQSGGASFDSNAYGWLQNEKILFLERRLRSLQEDPYWIATRCLREVKKLIPFQPKRRTQIIHPSPKVFVARESEYLQHLRQQIGLIKSSRSWYLRRLLRGSIFKNLRHERRSTSKPQLDQQPTPLGLHPRSNCQPLVSWNPLDELITEVIFDYRLSHQTPLETQRRIHESLDATLPEISAPAITVIICMEHSADVNLIKALAVQTLPRETFEVILIDCTGYQRNSEKIRATAHELKDAIPLRAFKAHKGGRPYAHNIGLRLTATDKVIFLASDFLPPKDFVETHLNFHLQNPGTTNGAIAGAVFPERLRDSIFRRWLDDSGSLFGVSFMETSQQLPANFFYTGNSSLKTAVLFEAGLFDEEFQADAWDDYEMGLRLSRQGVQFQYLPNITCIHEHEVRLSDRFQSMKKAGQAAHIVDKKYLGKGPWNVRNSKTAAITLALKGIRDMLSYTVTRDSKKLSSAFDQLLNSAFLYWYRTSRVKKVSPF